MTAPTPDLVRSSCGSFRSPVVRLNEETLQKFVSDQDFMPYPGLLEFRNGSTNTFTELTFENDAEEAGFIALAHGLDFGSGFRLALHKYRNGQGAWLTVRAGLIALAQWAGTSTVKASWLRKVDRDTVRKLWDLGDHEKLQPLVEQIFAVLDEFSRVMDDKGITSLGAFVEAHPTAVGLTTALVEAFPITFRDEYVLTLPPRSSEPSDDHQMPPPTTFVALYKKAQLVVSEIHIRFSTTTNHKFKFADYRKLTAFVDNVVVATLRKTGVLECAPPLEAQLNEGTPVLRGSVEEVSLRAVGLQATEKAVVAYNEKHNLTGTGNELTPGQLANWLWGHLGKREDFRAYPRHYCPTTLFY